MAEVGGLGAVLAVAAVGYHAEGAEGGAAVPKEAPRRREAEGTRRAVVRLGPAVTHVFDDLLQQPRLRPSREGLSLTWLLV